MAVVRLDELSCTFTGGTLAVNEVSFELAAGELFCLLGPSGCGKSTLLRLIGGYLEPDAGRVWINERDVTREPPERRNTGMVFQNYALFPHLNALENVAFGLRVKGINKAARTTKANEMLDWVKTGEAALSGTAAVLAGVGTLIYRGAEHKVAGGDVGPLTRALRAQLVAVQQGQAEDKHRWLQPV